MYFQEETKETDHTLLHIYMYIPHEKKNNKLRTYHFRDDETIQAINS